MGDTSKQAATAGTVALGDLVVNRMAFGAMRVCGPDVWGPPKDRAAAHGLFRHAVSLGIDFFDTADSYGPEVDETLIAEALHPYPKGLVIGTKGGLVRPRPSAWDPRSRVSSGIRERRASGEQRQGTLESASPRLAPARELRQPESVPPAADCQN